MDSDLFTFIKWTPYVLILVFLIIIFIKAVLILLGIILIIIFLYFWNRFWNEKEEEFLNMGRKKRG